MAPGPEKTAGGKKHGLNLWKLGIETSMFVSEKVGGETKVVPKKSLLVVI